MASTIDKLCADAIVAYDMSEGAKAHFKERCAPIAAEARRLKMKREALRMKLGPLAEAYYPGAEWKKRGKSWVFSSGTEGATAKQCVNRILGEVYGVNKAKEVAVPAHIARLAKALAKACAEHDEKKARSIAAKAVAQSW